MSDQCTHARVWPVRYWFGERSAAPAEVCRDCGAERFVTPTGGTPWSFHVPRQGEHFEPLPPHPMAAAGDEARWTARGEAS